MLIAKNLLTREASYKVFGTHRGQNRGQKTVQVNPERCESRGEFVGCTGLRSRESAVRKPRARPCARQFVISKCASPLRRAYSENRLK